MAERDPLHQPASEQGGLVYIPCVQQTPLLPFEKQLIDLLGCTEEEYRRFVEEARKRAAVRPAAYDMVPDVQAGPAAVPIIVSLAIGVATTAVSYLLAPKPRAPVGAGSSEVQQRELASIVGPNRFNPTYGFDGQTQLANYQDPIQVVFGRYTGTTGGIVVTPSLVWSRMFSYGTQQGVKLLFVVGEQGEDGGQVPQGIDPPSLNGIFLGNGPLDAVYASSFAIYWKRNTTLGAKRVKAANLLYGTRGITASGDPETFDDIFSVPTAASDNDYGFSSAHRLNNNAVFGCYEAIPNGTAYRLNWQIIPILRLEGQEDDPGDNLIAKRIKISGDNNGLATTLREARQLGQFGTGRNYSRRMGITALNGSGVSDAEGTAERSIAVGDVIDFTISSANVPSDLYDYGNVTVDDINNYIDQERIRADEALVIGELFMIGRSVWQVISRSLPLWTPDSAQDQIVQLRCVELTNTLPERNKIGIVSNAVLTRAFLSDSGNNGETTPVFAGTAFYPLMRFALATVRNTRACEVTEIGLKSSVYQRLNGLANFQDIPSPAQLVQLENDRVSITLGANTSFIQRVSVFIIQLRPAGLDANGQPYQWGELGLRFAVSGSQPVDAYNFIRIKHPERKQYEFRFVPKNGADMRLTPDTSIIWKLNAAGSQQGLLAENVPTIYGLFEVRSTGTVVTKYDITRNKEFTTRPSFKPSVQTKLRPSAVGIYAFVPELADSSRVTRLEYLNVYSDPTGFTVGRSHAFAYELFGGAGAAPIPVGAYIERSYREDLSDGRWVQIRYRARKITLPAGHYSNRGYSWEFQSYTVEGSSTNWRAGTEFIASRTLSEANPYRVVPGQGTMISAGLIFKAVDVQGFTGNLGRAQGWYHELFGDATQQAVNYYKTVEIPYTGADGKRIKLFLGSYVVEDPSHWSGRKKLWANPVIGNSRESGDTTTNWKEGDRFESTTPVSASNPFLSSSQVSNVGVIFEILSVTNQETTPLDPRADRTFEFQSQFADVSFYGNLVEKSNSSAPEHSIVYVNEITANETIPNYDNMTLCGIALKAGKNFNSLDQIRMWLPNGLHVYRFHPQYANNRYGPSNHFTDLVYYFLTSNVGGLGASLRMTPEFAALVNAPDLETTAKFLETNSLYYDGNVGTPRNIRQFISELAPYFLCNFVISDGQFSLRPAVPVTSGGSISTKPIPIKQIFTAGNIIEDSFEVQFLDAEERKDFQCIMRYREGQQNQLPQERNIVARWNNSPETAPIESFDMTEFCTSRAHAELAAKFFLSVRRRVTHSITFSTTPYGMDLAPGDYIKVVTEANPYSAARNGVIGSSGEITSVSQISSGQYSILYYKVGSEDVQRGTMTVAGGYVTEPALFDSVFTIQEATTSCNVYMVEQLTITEDFLANITASEFPCDDDGASLIALDILNDGNFIFES